MWQKKHVRKPRGHFAGNGMDSFLDNESCIKVWVRFFVLQKTLRLNLHR